MIKPNNSLETNWRMWKRNQNAVVIKNVWSIWRNLKKRAWNGQHLWS